MFSIFCIIAFIAVIECFKSPKGVLVNDVNIKILDIYVQDCKIDEIDNVLEKLMDVSNVHDTLFSNIEKGDESKPKDLEDITAEDIMKVGKDE